MQASVITKSINFEGRLGAPFSTRCNPLRLLARPPRTPACAPARLVAQTTNAQATSTAPSASGTIQWTGLHHVGLLCENLERSVAFYSEILGLEVNPDRPDAKLPYRGTWFWIGPEMVHLMELPNPDPMDGRPEHGGRDRHFCVGVESIAPLEQRLKAAGIPYTLSKSGRAAIFFRDPDMNTLEVVELEPWRS